MASASPVTLAECGPIFVFSTLSAHARDCRAACFRRPISFSAVHSAPVQTRPAAAYFHTMRKNCPAAPRCCCGLWIGYDRRSRLKTRGHARRAENRTFRQIPADERAARLVQMIRWLVDEQIPALPREQQRQQKLCLFAAGKRGNKRYSASSVTASGASSRRNRHSGTSGKLRSSSSSGVSDASGTGYGKYSNPPGAVIVP